MKKETSIIRNAFSATKKAALSVKEMVTKRNDKSKRAKRKALDAKSEAENLDSLVFFDNEDILSFLDNKGFQVHISPFYYVLYSISPKIVGFNIINIKNFIDSGNVLFIPSDFRDDIELVNAAGEILISFTPGVGNQEILLNHESDVIGIRRSSKLKGAA